MRLPLASDLLSRDGTTDKDACMVNAVKEVSGSAELASVRPGLNQVASFSGAGRGLVAFKDTVLSVYDADLRMFKPDEPLQLSPYITGVTGVASDVLAWNGESGLVASEGWPGYRTIYSLNGLDWDAVTVAAFTNQSRPHFVNGQFVFFGQIGGVWKCYTSATGASWAEAGDVTGITPTSTTKILYKSGTYYYFGIGDVYTSSDLLSWSLLASGILDGAALQSRQMILHGSSFFAATAGSVFESSDAVSWSSVFDAPSGSYIGSNGYIGGLWNGGLVFKAGLTEQYIYSSFDDGSTWIGSTIPVESGNSQVAAVVGSSCLVAVSTGEVYRSFDMLTWRLYSSDAPLYKSNDASIYIQSIGYVVSPDVPNNGDIGYFNIPEGVRVSAALTGEYFDSVQSTL